MAEAKTAPHTRSGDGSPKLVAMAEERPAAPTPASAVREPARDGVSRFTFTLVAVLLAVALVGLLAQTRRASVQAERIAALDIQIGELQEQLSVAHTRLATYDMQFSMVQATVDDLFQRMTDLHELVSTDPFAAEPSESEGR